MDSDVRTIFKLHVLAKITDDFSDKKIVGLGGYGTVYKGLHEEKEIAVKKLHPLHGLNDEPFDKEFDTLSKIHHQNIVELIGFCYESHRTYIKHKDETITAMVKERILCFEYMQGGSLDKHIAENMCDLDWNICYKIIRGTSEGLNHLHNTQDRPIYHLDLKPANILLDKNFTPKIADLGLSRIVANTKTHHTQRATIQGTFGYMPPEYIDSCDISKKFDVFSLGGIIIRIMDGNACNSRYSSMGAKQFVQHVIACWERRLHAASSNQSHQGSLLEVRKCLEIGLRSVEKDRIKRPTIKDIVTELAELDSEIKRMLLHSDQSADPDGQRRSGPSIAAVDPKALRFLFEPRKDISTCLELTNLTDSFTAFQIKSDKTKYLTRPDKGIMPPCSKCNISVTLKAMEQAPPNMQCNDKFIVQSANVSMDLKPYEITDDLFEDGMVVDMVNLPVAYVPLDNFNV